MMRLESREAWAVMIHEMCHEPLLTLNCQASIARVNFSTKSEKFGPAPQNKVVRDLRVTCPHMHVGPLGCSLD